MISIREANINDIDSIMEINLSSFSHPYNAELFTKAIEEEIVTVLVAESDGQVVGYCEGMFLMMEMEIQSLAVKEEYRRHGVATMLMDTMLARMGHMGVKDVFLEVRRGNKAARELYKRNGFKTIDMRKNYYQKPVEDACIMHHKIENEGLPC